MSLDLEAIRQQFPSLRYEEQPDGVIPVFFDNPAGTQVPQRVIDAITDYYTTSNVNMGGLFAASQRTDAILYAAREAMADFVNAPRPEEIVFGPNMTTLNFALSRAIATQLSAGDEVVVTRMDHDANVSPWLTIARDNDLTVKWVEFNTEDGTLDMASLEGAISEKTRLVAAVHASNALGTINPVAQIADIAHAVGAYFVVDAVQSAPHLPLDVQQIGCDFLLCSAYKFFGPHIGIMWGKYELLETLPAYKVRPSKDVPPYRWETGTLSFETIAGTAAAVDYIASLAEAGDYAGFTGRRAQIRHALANINAYERALAERLIGGLQEIKGVSIAGLTDAARYDQRVATVSFLVEGYSAPDVAAHLAKNHIHARYGDYYATEVMAKLGQSEEGMVRVGAVHYNTLEEVNRFLNVLAAL